jgi:hypothetical protein
MTAGPETAVHNLLRLARALADRDIVGIQEAACAGDLTEAPTAPDSDGRLRRFCEVDEAPREPMSAGQYLRWLRE